MLVSISFIDNNTNDEEQLNAINVNNLCDIRPVINILDNHIYPGFKLMSSQGDVKTYYDTSKGKVLIRIINKT